MVKKVIEVMKKFWKIGGRWIILGAGIFLLAFLLRIYNLNILPVFGDEAIYIRWAQVMRAEPSLRFLPLSDGKQPLFMWVVIAFQKVIADPLIAGRAVSVAAGLGSLIGVFILTKVLLKSRKVAFLASVIYALSPFSIFFDRIALADSMLTFFGVWALTFAVITVKKVRLDTAMLAGFSLGGALLTKSPAVFFAVLLPFTVVLGKWPKKLKEKFSLAGVYTFLFSFTYAIGYGLYNILRLGPEFHMISIRNKDYVYPLAHALEAPFSPFITHLKAIFGYFWLMGPSVLLALLLIGIYFGLKNKKRETLILAAWAILPILAVAQYSRTMTARYIYFSVPFIFILAAASFLEIRKSLSKYIKIFFAIFIVHSLFLDLQLVTNPQSAKLPRSERSGYLEEWTAGYGINEVADYLESEHQKAPDQKIVVGTEGFFGTLPDALQAYLADTPEVTVIGVGQPVRGVPEQLIESKRVGNKTYLVVNNTRFVGDSEELGLRLIEEYPKAENPEGEKERLLFFEVTQGILDND